MKRKSRIFKILSYVFAAIAVLLFITAVSVVISDGSGFIDLSNFVAIIILCFALTCSALGAIFALIDKTSRNQN